MGGSETCSCSCFFFSASYTHLLLIVQFVGDVVAAREQRKRKQADSISDEVTAARNVLPAEGRSSAGVNASNGSAAVKREAAIVLGGR